MKHLEDKRATLRSTSKEFHDAMLACVDNVRRHVDMESGLLSSAIKRDSKAFQKSVDKARVYIDCGIKRRNSVLQDVARLKRQRDLQYEKEVARVKAAASETSVLEPE